MTLTLAGTMGPVTDSDADSMRAKRKRAGITIKQLAQRAGVAPNTVSRVEKGEQAHKRELVEAALDELLAETHHAPAASTTADARNLRALTAQLPEGQAIISVERVRDLSDPAMTVYTVVAADDGADDDQLRQLFEKLWRRYQGESS